VQPTIPSVAAGGHPLEQPATETSNNPSNDNAGSNWIGCMRPVDVRDAAESLEVLIHRTLIARCPACGQERPVGRNGKLKSSGRTGVVVTPNGLGSRCLACGVGGDALDYVARTLCGRRLRDCDGEQFQVVREWCVRFLGLSGAAATGGSYKPRPRREHKAPELEPEPRVLEHPLAAALRLPAGLRDCAGELLDEERLSELCKLLCYHRDYDVRPFELDIRSRWHRTLGAVLTAGVSPQALCVAVNEVGSPEWDAMQPRIAERRARELEVPEVPIALREVLGFEARLLLELPAATTLVCRTTRTEQTVVVTNARAVYAAARARDLPAIVGGEWAALVRSTEQDRVWPADVEQLIERKLKQPDVRIRFFDRDLIGTVEPEHWTTARVLRRVGLELLDVGVGDEIPAALTPRDGDHE